MTKGMPTEEYAIIVPTTYEQEHYEAVIRLMAQLTTRDIVFTPEMYRELITSASNQLMLLQAAEGAVVGMLTLGIYGSPTGSKAWIEDVVVDESYRGRSLGRRLVAHAIDVAREKGIDTLMLTSNPKRIAANELYRSLGFEKKETNMYKMKL